MALSLAERKPGGRKSRLEERATRRTKKAVARRSRRIVDEATREHGHRCVDRRESVSHTCIQRRFASKNRTGKVSVRSVCADAGRP